MAVHLSDRGTNVTNTDAVYYGSRNVLKVYSGSKLVWPSKYKSPIIYTKYTNTDRQLTADVFVENRQADFVTVDWGDGTQPQTLQLVDGHGVIQHTYGAAKTYAIRWDAKGTIKIEHFVLITPHALVLHPTVTGQDVALDVAMKTQGPVTIDWGDGSPQEAVPWATSTDTKSTMAHTYANDGNFTITGLDSGATTTVTATVQPSVAAPVFEVEDVDFADVKNSWRETLMHIHLVLKDPSLTWTLLWQEAHGSSWYSDSIFAVNEFVESGRTPSGWIKDDAAHYRIAADYGGTFMYGVGREGDHLVRCQNFWVQVSDSAGRVGASQVWQVSAGYGEDVRGGNKTWVSAWGYFTQASLTWWAKAKGNVATYRGTWPDPTVAGQVTPGQQLHGFTQFPPNAENVIWFSRPGTDAFAHVARLGGLTAGVALTQAAVGAFDILGSLDGPSILAKINSPNTSGGIAAPVIHLTGGQLVDWFGTKFAVASGINIHLIDDAHPRVNLGSTDDPTFASNRDAKGYWTGHGTSQFTVPSNPGTYHLYTDRYRQPPVATIIVDAPPPPSRPTFFDGVDGAQLLANVIANSATTVPTLHLPANTAILWPGAGKGIPAGTEFKMFENAPPNARGTSTLPAGTHGSGWWKADADGEFTTPGPGTYKMQTGKAPYPIFATVVVA